ncbi:MAG: hypothetical protein HOP11_14190 [Saprospiraceae bacterium]|nr:hypothetical protein [Saprospiraceae bacterium]
MKKIIYFLLLVSTFNISCDDDDIKNDVTVYSTSINDLPADPGTGFDPMTGAPLGTTGHYTFFRFSDSSYVNLEDSAKGKWDLGFRGSKIIVNGGTSGPGNVLAATVSGIFEDYNSIPENVSFTNDNGAALVIGSTWGIYDAQNMVFKIDPGKIILLRCNDGNYAKLQVLSYYKNAPAVPDARKDLPRYYTFRYVYQSNGSKNFK